MPKNHSYVLGINAYDHDVSACLLRDGEIAYAIEKERITRKKHAGGFFQEVVDYCLQAEGITLDDAVVRRGVKAILDDPRKGRLFVAEDGGKVVGSTYVTFEWSDWHEAWYWWIQSAFVVPETDGLTHP